LAPVVAFLSFLGMSVDGTARAVWHLVSHCRVSSSFIRLHWLSCQLTSPNGLLPNCISVFFLPNCVFQTFEYLCPLLSLFIFRCFFNRNFKIPCLVSLPQGRVPPLSFFPSCKVNAGCVPRPCLSILRIECDRHHSSVSKPTVIFLLIATGSTRRQTCSDRTARRGNILIFLHLS